MKRIFATLFIAAAAQWASADGLKSLESFMQGTQAARADFTQVVTSPGKDGQAARQKTSSGQFEFQRPGRFRFDYKKPFEQTIVADGQTLWFYDVDLNQVTQRPQAQALSNTPAALLASVRVGLRGDQLEVLEILDSFGQRSVIRFANLQANLSLPATTFQFKPPAGVDVLKQ